MKHMVDVDITTAGGVEDISNDIEDMIFECTVQLKACPFKIIIDNSNGSWDDKFGKFDEVEINVEKTAGGGSYKDMFGGRILQIRGKKQKGKKKTILLYGFDYFHDLQGLLHSGIFINQYAGTTISNLLQEYAPHIDRTNIDVGPQLDYYGCQDKPLSEIIIEILDQPECAGWYFWLVGKNAYFKDRSETAASLQLINMRDYDVKRDSYEYVNRQKVYGATKPFHPDGADTYTEQDAANWSGTHIALSDETEKFKRGDYSLKATHDVSFERHFYRSFLSAQNLNMQETLKFWILQDSILPVQIRLETDSSNYYYRNYTPGAADEWFEREYQVGADSLGWTANGSPDWTNIIGVRFYYPATDPTTTLTYLDYFRFAGIAIIKVAEDWASQKDVGFVKEAPPIVDASIRDPDFAEKLAQAALASYGVERVEITVPQFYSAIDLDKFNEGEQVLVQITDEDIDDQYVLWLTKYRVTKLGLTVKYYLGSKPSDFITQLKFLKKELERIKQAQIDPTRNYDIWNRFQLEVPEITVLLNDIGDSKFEHEILWGTPLLFNFNLPGTFGGLGVSLEISEES